MEEIPLRGGFRTKDPRLDRIPQFDPKSRNYGVAAVLPNRAPRTIMWGCDQVLDQGAEGACVGFAWTYELIAEPFPTTGLTDATAQEFYREAKRLDDFPGEAYEGSSVLGGAKAITEKAFLTEYRWAFTFDEVLQAVSFRGPVVLGVNWYASMYETQAGYVRIAGEVVGGHAIMGRGVDMERGALILRNSWGPSWGGGMDTLGAGDAYISFDDLRRLLAEGGECCVPVLRQ